MDRFRHEPRRFEDSVVGDHLRNRLRDLLIGLLFLLVKERTTTGYVEVSVHSGDLYHKTQIPVTDPMQVQQIRQLVGQPQTLAARAR
jgi:hypothetical protein